MSDYRPSPRRTDVGWMRARAGLDRQGRWPVRPRTPADTSDSSIEDEVLIPGGQGQVGSGLPVRPLSQPASCLFVPSCFIRRPTACHRVNKGGKTSS